VIVAALDDSAGIAIKDPVFLSVVANPLLLKDHLLLRVLHEAGRTGDPAVLPEAEGAEHAERGSSYQVDLKLLIAIW
jgi:hypothetical protein